MAVFTTMTGIATITWPFATNESQLITIATIYGYALHLFTATCSTHSSRFSLGAYTSLYSAPLVAMGQMEDAGRRVGMFMSLIAFGGIAGPPISGAISTATGGFVVAGYYSGKCMTHDLGVNFIKNLTLPRWHHYIWCCVAICSTVPPSWTAMGQILKGSFNEAS